MSPGLHDSPTPSVSPIIEQEPLLPPDDDSENVPQLSNPNETASQSSTSFASPVEEAKSDAVSSMTLHRSVYIPAFVLGYTALAIFAWVVTCILSYRPITTDHYGVSLRTYDANATEMDIHSLFVQNEQWFRVARFIQSIVTVLTIPLTSAVCSKAAIVFVQRQSGLSLRQTMTLADKGWTEPRLYIKLLFGGLKRYGSSFLFFAILLNILGGIISPLQSLFLTPKTIKTPTWPSGVLSQLTDILDPFILPLALHDSGLVPVMVRSAITSTSTTDLQNSLWTSSPIICSTVSNKTDTPCTLGGITLANMSSLPNPFFAQLPSGYNTGLIRQFLPRINSSATREVITEAEFPANCDKLPGSFYVNYANAIEVGNWSLIACMPANQTRSPWKAVRTRQDFSEELYLNLSASFPGVRPLDEAQGGFFKITVNTTAGFFELPNYMNGQLPGPLLDDDPSNHCGLDCVSQGTQVEGSNKIHNHNLTSLTRRDGTNIISNTSLGLEMSPTAKGPLLNIAIALFGEGSFIPDRLTHPDTYINANLNLDRKCTEQVPLIGLLHSSLGESQQSIYGVDPCIRKNVDDVSLQNKIALYVSSLYFNDADMDRDGYGYSGKQIKNAFESAAFLANEAWLQSSNVYSLTVNYNLGADTVIPAISLAGIILISVLLAVDLLSLLAMALYSVWTPCWTDQLDAFAMMRIGAAIAESIPFRVADTTDQIQVLDETPGWVGDATEGKGEVGELGLGASMPLRGRRKYACY